MTVETDSLHKIVDGLIAKASGILFPNPSEEPPTKVSFYQKFSDPTAGQEGQASLWVIQNGSRRLRVSMTTVATAAIATPYTLLRLEANPLIEPKQAAHFRRRDYPDQVNLELDGLAAIEPATEFLALLQASFKTGTLTFPTQ